MKTLVISQTFWWHSRKPPNRGYSQTKRPPKKNPNQFRLMSNCQRIASFSPNVCLVRLIFSRVGFLHFTFYKGTFGDFWSLSPFPGLPIYNLQQINFFQIKVVLWICWLIVSHLDLHEILTLKLCHSFLRSWNFILDPQNL